MAPLTNLIIFSFEITGGHKLKSTGKADKMKEAGNLAAPITNIRDDKETKKKIQQQKAQNN